MIDTGLAISTPCGVFVYRVAFMIGGPEILDIGNQKSDFVFAGSVAVCLHVGQGRHKALVSECRLVSFIKGYGHMSFTSV